MEFVGKTVRIEYASGLEVEAHYETIGRMHWKCLAGPAVGTSGSEVIQCHTIREGLYMINWVKASGTTVTNVLDFFEGRATAYVTFQAGDTRRGMLDTGHFTIES